MAEKSMAEVKAVKDKHQAELLRKANVVGVAVGYREKAGQMTDQVALTVMVKKKVPLSQLDAKDVIPPEIEGVMIDVGSDLVLRFRRFPTIATAAVQTSAGSRQVGGWSKNL